MEYITPAVRHLAWSIFSEPMASIPNVEPLFIEPSPELMAWLNKLDERPSALLDYLATENTQLLGSYFECLWQFFFQYAPNWQLLSHHVQIFEKRQTLGELDTIVRQPNRSLHVELAVKFYLLPKDKSGQAASHWLGPQSRDRLDLKLKKLEEKQLPFLYHSATQQTLIEQSLPNEPAQALVMKGYLFEPRFPESNATQFNSAINLHVNKGHWLHARETIDVINGKALWAIIPKKQWLGPYIKSEQDDINLLNSHQAQTFITEHFTNNKHPYALMLIKLQPHQQDWYETQRFMVVHDQWPDKAN